MRFRIAIRSAAQNRPRISEETAILTLAFMPDVVCSHASSQKPRTFEPVLFRVERKGIIQPGRKFTSTKLRQTRTRTPFNPQLPLATDTWFRNPHLDPPTITRLEDVT